MSDPDAVTCGYVCQNEVIYSWHKSMLELLAYDMVTNQRLKRGGFVATRFGADGMSEARNKTVQSFLGQEDADWLWWIDTDMGFAPDIIDRLFEAADAEERPIVGGLCFFNAEDKADGTGGYRHTVMPTIYDWVHTDDGQLGWQIRRQFNTNTLTQVGGTGGACVLVHRSVYERIEAAHGKVWYDRIPNTTTGQRIGEDLSFCLRAGALQIPMFVHTGIGTTHYKHQWLAEEDYWNQVAFKLFSEKMIQVKDTENKVTSAKRRQPKKAAAK